jgi:hypothetical protein
MLVSVVQAVSRFWGLGPNHFFNSDKVSDSTCHFLAPTWVRKVRAGAEVCSQMRIIVKWPVCDLKLFRHFP